MRKLVHCLLAAFQCMLHGQPLNIPTEISADYVCYAEEIADISYSQSETFSSDRHALLLV